MARRLQVLQYIVSSLQKLAATRDLAVVVLTQCATMMQAERGATLAPAINAAVWEQGMSTRLVLFRDWLHGAPETRGLHFVAIQKLNGKGVGALLESICAFKVDKVSAEPWSSLQPLTSAGRLARGGVRQHLTVQDAHVYPGAEAETWRYRLGDRGQRRRRLRLGRRRGAPADAVTVAGKRGPLARPEASK